MQCPKCANVLMDDVRVCLYCGAEIEAPPPKAPNRSIPPPVQPPVIQQDTRQPQPDARLTLSEIRTGLVDSSVDEPVYSQSGKELKKPGFTLFSAKGRLNRLKYFYFYMFSLIAQIFLRVGIASVSVDSAGAWLVAVYYPIVFFLAVLQIITVIKRFHDIGKPGQYAMTLFIPFYNIYMAFKLLFKDSEQGINTYGPYERNSWFWQVPVTLLLLPVVYYGLTAGGVAQTMATQNAEPLHYYNQSQQISMTFPEGWKEVRMEGYLTAAQDFSGSRLIALETMATADPSFSEYSEEEIQLMISNVGDTEFLADMLGYQYWNVTGLNSTKRTINGTVFLVADFTQKQDRVQYRQVYLFGCEDGKYITIQLVISNPDEERMAELLASVDTLRIGDSATAEPAMWD